MVEARELAAELYFCIFEETRRSDLSGEQRGDTVHPAIPDLRRTYGSVYARFTLGSTPVLRSGFVRFASGLVGIRTGLLSFPRKDEPRRRW